MDHDHLKRSNTEHMIQRRSAPPPSKSIDDTQNKSSRDFIVDDPLDNTNMGSSGGLSSRHKTELRRPRKTPTLRTVLAKPSSLTSSLDDMVDVTEYNYQAKRKYTTYSQISETSGRSSTSRAGRAQDIRSRGSDPSLASDITQESVISQPPVPPPLPPVFSFQSDPLPTNPSTIPSHQKATRPNLSRLKTIGVSNVAIRSYQPLSGYQSSDSPTPSDLSSPQVPLSAVSVVSSPVKRQATVTENVRPRRRAKSIDANSMSMGGIMRRKTTRVMRREMEFESLVINELQEPIPDVHNQIEDNSQRGSSNNRQSLASNSSSGVPKSKSSADVFTFSNITTNVMSFSTMMSNVSRVGYQQATSVSSALHSALASPTNLQNFLPFSKFGRSASRETLHSLGAQSQLPEIQRSKESLVTTNTTTNSSLIPQILTSSDISSELQSPIGHQQPFTIPFERATSFLSGPLTDAMNFWKQKLDEQTERLRQWTLESQNRVQEKQTQLDSEKEKMESVMSQVAQRSVTTKSRTLKKRATKLTKTALSQSDLNLAQLYSLRSSVSKDFGSSERIVVSVSTSSTPNTEERISRLRFDGGDSQEDSVTLTVTQRLSSDHNLHSPCSEANDESSFEKQGSVFIAALNTLTISRSQAIDDTNAHVNTADTNNAESEQMLQEKDIENEVRIVPSQPRRPFQLEEKMDYSEVFPEHIGTQEGINVFRIEYLYPVLQHRDSVGQFCVADCYIILVTQVREARTSGGDTISYQGQDTFEYAIFTWIGEEAEMDKRFCAALYSVGLRNWLNAPCRVLREVQGDESEEFKALFLDDFVRLDATEGTESGLFVAEAKTYPLRMYRFYANQNIHLELVEPSKGSLKSDSVFLIDWGMEMYQWNGSNSVLQHRSKCRMLCQRINKLERTGKVEFEEFDEGSESERFWEILEYEQNEGLCESIDQSPVLSAIIPTVPDIYTTGIKATSSDPMDSVLKYTKLKRSLLKSDQCYILDWEVEIYLWVGKVSTQTVRASATELLANIISSKERVPWLALTKCMEGFEPESLKIRFSDWDTPDKEAINWDDLKLGKLTSGFVGQISKEKVQVKVDALYAPASAISPSEGDITATLDYMTDCLQSFTAFVYQKGKFVQVSEEEKCHFYSHDACLFLCVYEQPVNDPDIIDYIARRKSSQRHNDASRDVTNTPDLKSQDDTIPATTKETDLQDHDKSPEDELEILTELVCIVYFWKGRSTSNLPFSTFKLKTCHEMEALVQELYGCSLRIVHVEQGSEPISLLCHLNNIIITRKGTRAAYLKELVKTTKRRESPPTIGTGSAQIPTTKSDLQSRYRLFQVQIDSKFQTTRVTQMQLRSCLLVSRDCFFLQSTSSDSPHYLWVGRGVSETQIDLSRTAIETLLRYDTNHARGILSGMNSSQSSVFTSMENMSAGDISASTSPSSQSSHLNFEMVFENDEDDIFWSLFERGEEKCSCSQGFFSVDEILHFSQVDCRPDTCIILDPTSPYSLYFWIGREASDVVKAYSLKAVEAWLDHLNDGRTFTLDEQYTNVSKRISDTEKNTSASVTCILQGNEPIEFRAFFHAWESDNSLLQKLDAGSDFSRRMKESKQQVVRDKASANQSAPVQDMAS